MPLHPLAFPTKAASLCIGLLVTSAWVHAEPPAVPSLQLSKRAAPTPHIDAPLPEPDHAGAALASPFGSRALAPNVTGQTLTAPVTVNANTSADALTATQTGTGRALNGVINNANSTLTALKGATNGKGAALGGLNSGTTGPAAQLQITNASSSQPALVVTTAGTGNAVQAIVSTAESDTPAVLGQHNGSSAYGVGVEGDGGVHGRATDIGVYGESSTGYGTYGISSSGSGVVGTSTSGAGVYGYSDSSYAGYFQGKVIATGTVTAQSYLTSSDRNVKQAIEPVDATSVLDRVAAMPISSWDFQAQPGIHHIGPMAQDFRAAFGLGADDTHIDLVDGVGVSLAAIQALQQQLTASDERAAAKDARAAQQQARIDALESQMQRLQQAIARVSAADH